MDQGLPWLWLLLIMLPTSAPAPATAASDKRRLPFMLHFHKSAGSALCRLAVKQNGLAAAGVNEHKKLGFNCNILGDDPGHLGFVQSQHAPLAQAAGGLSCDKRRSYMRQHGLTFCGVERWLFAHELCPDRFVYVTCLRHPIARLQSSVRFHRHQTPSLVMQWAQHDEFVHAAPISNGSPAVDNFHVRTLAGMDVYRKPLGNVTTDDLATAKAVLQQFEVVLILEHLDRDRVQLAAILGWQHTQLPKSNRSRRKITWTKSQLRELTKLNQHDLSLFAFGNALAANISATARVRCRQGCGSGASVNFLAARTSDNYN